MSSGSPSGEHFGPGPEVASRGETGFEMRRAVPRADGTEPWRAEEALRESEDRFRRLFEGHSAIKLVIDPDTGDIVDANPAAADFYGWSVGELKRMRIQQINTLPPEVVGGLMEKVRSQQSGRFEFRHRRADGSISEVEVFSNPVQIAGRVLLFSIIHDITERKRLERELARHEAYLHAIIENEPECVKVVSADGVLLQMNPAGLKMIEVESLAEAQSRPLVEFVDAKYQAAFGDMLRKVLQGESVELEFEAVGLKGGRRWLATRAVPMRDPSTNEISLLGVTRDITERKRAETEREQLEAQTRQLQKSESLSRMAGAIAHHFNNQLHAVMANLELALDRSLGFAGEPLEYLTDAMEAARKAAETSTLMLTYLGQTVTEHELLDLSEVGRRSVSFLRSALPTSLVLEANLPSPGPVVRGDASQIQQVLANLVTNAREATGNRPGAIRVTVKTVAAAEIPTSPRFPVGCQLGDPAYACLEVADSGCGIPAADIDKLFDPFFSHKSTGRGMGLPVALGIVRSHGGAITVESELGRGSTFRIFLPLWAQAAPRRPVLRAQAPRTDRAQTVLLVDDESSVRKAASLGLKHLGFGVVAAADGREAVEVFRQRQNEIALVLCDLTMPRMGGWETLAALRELEPKLPVILASGYSEAQAMQGQHAERPQAFLGKPYDLKTLRDTIRRVLAVADPSEADVTGR